MEPGVDQNKNNMDNQSDWLDENNKREEKKVEQKPEPKTSLNPEPKPQSEPKKIESLGSKKSVAPKPGDVVKPSPKPGDSVGNEEEEKIEKAVEATEKKHIKRPEESELGPKPEPKKIKKSVITALFIVLVFAILGVGGYFLYSSGVLSNLIDQSTTMFSELTNKEVVEENQPVQEEPVQPEENQQQSTTSLKYIEDKLTELEEKTDAISRNYKLDEFLNLDDSDF